MSFMQVKQFEEEMLDTFQLISWECWLRCCEEGFPGYLGQVSGAG